MSNVITILALSDYPIHSYPKNTSYYHTKPAIDKWDTLYMSIVYYRKPTFSEKFMFLFLHSFSFDI